MNRMKTPRARRAILYVPGNETRKIEKAVTLGADSVCLDLEDGVAPNRKAEARETIARAFRALAFGASEKLSRINGVGTGFELDDLEALVPARPDGIVVPKVNDAEELRWVSARVREIESRAQIAPGSIALLGMIESARGLVNAVAIANADARVEALIFGAEDYAADVGATRTREGLEVLYARSAVVAACAAADIQAIDLLYLDFRDADGLRAETRRGAQLGYVGTQVIHPNQVPLVQEIFTPDDAAIAAAQRIVDAAAEHLAQGRGAFALDHKMVDMPIIKAAERVLARARAAGKIAME
ncbi:CoA ester lyase [Anaerolineae bacterium CFX7]|nr:CoA ester lyase [Anaerolineae bacterium CFX7]